MAVQNMKVGDKWALKIPANLAFGDKGVKVHEREGGGGRGKGTTER